MRLKAAGTRRQAERAQVPPEAAATAATVLAGRPRDTGPMMRAWHPVLFNQFHDLLCGTAIHGNFIKRMGVLDPTPEWSAAS